MMLLGTGCNKNEVSIPAEQKEAVTPIATPVEDESKEEPKETPLQVEEKEQIVAIDDLSIIDGLNLCNKYTLELSEKNIELEVYANAQVDENGELLLDDGQEWALIARDGQKIYPLVERSYIQNGRLNYTVYTNYDDEKLHILVENHSGASIIYYDYTYNETEETFECKTIFEANNINVLNKW